MMSKLTWPCSRMLSLADACKDASSCWVNLPLILAVRMPPVLLTISALMGPRSGQVAGKGGADGSGCRGIRRALRFAKDDSRGQRLRPATPHPACRLGMPGADRNETKVYWIPSVSTVVFGFIGSGCS